MSVPSHGRAAITSKSWKLFLVCQAVCVLGAGWGLWRGDPRVAVVSLAFLPQLLLWFFLVGEEQRLLVFIASLLPFTGLELLPVSYALWVLYFGTMGTLLFLHVTRFTLSAIPSPGLTPRERGPLLAFGVSVVVAALNAASRGWGSSSMLVSSVRALEMLLAAWFFGVVPQSLGQVRVLMYAMGAAIGLTGVGAFLVPTAVGEGGLLGGKAVQWLFAVVNLNALATIVASLCMVVVGAMLDTRRTSVRVGLAVVTFILLAALLYTRSRGAWLGFGVAVLYFLVRSRSRAFVLFSAMCFLLLFSLDIFRVSLTSRIGATSAQDPSLWGRFVLWAFAAKVVKANWLLGVGMENFGSVKYVFGYPFPRAATLGYNAHNLYLELLADLGIIGLLAFVSALGGALFSLDRLVRRGASKVNGGFLALGLAGGLIAYSTHGLLDSLTWHHGAFMLLGVMLGLAASLRRLAGDSKRASAQRPGMDPAGAQIAR